MERSTNKQLFEWLGKNIITLIVIIASTIIAYATLSAKVEALDARGQERTLQRSQQITDINTQLELIKSQYVTRTELNGTVISRLDRIENKLDEAIAKK